MPCFDIPLRGSRTTESTTQPPQARFRRFWRKEGDHRLGRSKCGSAADLTEWCGHDLDIIIAPLDGKFADSEKEYETLVELYDIPPQFVLERERSVTHSLGRQLGPDLKTETLWMHFLSEVPSTDAGSNRQPEWLKWGFILTWTPKPATSAPTRHTVSLIAFDPPVETMQRLVSLLRSPSWTDVTVDPYLLVDIALASWHERIDQVAWEVNRMVRADEEDVFRRARMLRSSDTAIVDLDLHRIHTSAKNAIFMVEALDAAIRSVDLALVNHGLLRGTAPGNDIWENTDRRLRHTCELFHSTKLRTASDQARIKNTVDLAFHINTVHDSQVNLDNSRSVRIISIVGMVFIPFGAVCSIFGTQFFSSADVARHIDLNPDFWMLWAIAVPLTLIILGVWKMVEPWCRSDHRK
ncbi:hypothetical protein QBC47DRAFT_451539 [Echria macrotheca]|uniref:Uncharacterized protein n=1 Tax=Echria macrotheca TaxID=438768 RepID=A0AAJ0F6N8_9PEZI|nr:hypothetical protein QBC47DRAFT_451539 [Echria macrotheca]